MHGNPGGVSQSQTQSQSQSQSQSHSQSQPSQSGPTHHTQQKRMQCQELLDNYRRVYDQFLEERKHYHHQMQRWNAKMQQEERKLDAGKLLRDRQQKIFHGSQFVEFANQPYDCSRNRSKFSCSGLASAHHEKCKCQQMFGGRPHLKAPCNPRPSIVGEELTYDRCKRKGYLDNHGLEWRMCARNHNAVRKTVEDALLDAYACPLLDRMESEGGDQETKPQAKAEEKDKKEQSQGRDTTDKADKRRTAGATQRPADDYSDLDTMPQPPILRLPTNTCGPCGEYFDRLKKDFSYANLAAVSRCISTIGRGFHHSSSASRDATAGAMASVSGGSFGVAENPQTYPARLAGEPLAGYSHKDPSFFAPVHQHTDHASSTHGNHGVAGGGNGAGGTHHQHGHGTRQQPPPNPKANEQDAVAAADKGQSGTGGLGTATGTNTGMGTSVFDSTNGANGTIGDGKNGLDDDGNSMVHTHTTGSFTAAGKLWAGDKKPLLTATGSLTFAGTPAATPKQSTSGGSSGSSENTSKVLRILIVIVIIALTIFLIYKIFKAMPYRSPKNDFRAANVYNSQANAANAPNSGNGAPLTFSGNGNANTAANGNAAGVPPWNAGDVGKPPVAFTRPISTL